MALKKSQLYAFLWQSCDELRGGMDASQYKDVTNAGLARLNMILHDFPTATILNGNTLAAPKFKEGEGLRTYDFVVATFPFSDKTWRTGLIPEEDTYERFTWGVPPADTRLDAARAYAVSKLSWIRLKND